jgi:hypothetical protein
MKAGACERAGMLVSALLIVTCAPTAIAGKPTKPGGGGGTPPAEPVFAVGLSARGYNIDIGVMDYAGASTTKLLLDNGGFNQPLWSEDGTEILVDYQDDLDLDPWGYVIFSVADPSQRRIVSFPGTVQEFGGIGSYAWSRHRGDSCGNLLAKIRLQNSLWFVTTDGEDLVTSLPLDTPPDGSVYAQNWSGNGQQLLYQVARSGPDPDVGFAYVVDQLRISMIPECVKVGGSISFNPDAAPVTVTIDVRALLKSALASADPEYPYDYVSSSWAAANSDGNLVVMRVGVSDVNGNARDDLWLLDRRSGTPVMHRITGPGRPDISESVFAPTWAPDDKEVAYLASDSRGKRIVNRLDMASCLASIDGGTHYGGCTATKVITKDIARLDWRPNWVRPTQ